MSAARIASARPGKKHAPAQAGVDAGFPKRTCANAKNLETYPDPFERDTL
jgi:hypothetical protein